MSVRPSFLQKLPALMLAFLTVPTLASLNSRVESSALEVHHSLLWLRVTPSLLKLVLQRPFDRGVGLSRVARPLFSMGLIACVLQATTPALKGVWPRETIGLVTSWNIVEAISEIWNIKFEDISFYYSRALAIYLHVLMIFCVFKFTNLIDLVLYAFL